MTCPRIRHGRTLPIHTRLFLAASLFLAATSHAGQPTSTPHVRFTLTTRACPHVPVPDVRRLLGIEIGDLLVAEAEAPPQRYDRLVIRCAGSFATIQAIGATSDTIYEQAVNLDDFPGDATPRALALTGLELLASMNTAVRLRLEGKNQPSPTPTPTPPPSPPLHETRIGLAGVWRMIPSDQGVTLWGGRAVLERTWSQKWHASADLETAHGQRSVDSLGTVDTWLFSTGATLGAYAHGTWLSGWLGLGARVGWVRLSGTGSAPADAAGRTVSHPWGGPMVVAGTRGRAGRFSLALSAEVGQSLPHSEGTAGEKTVISVGGTWVTVALGGGFHP